MEKLRVRSLRLSIGFGVAAKRLTQDGRVRFLAAKTTEIQSSGLDHIDDLNTYLCKQSPATFWMNLLNKSKKIWTNFSKTF